MSPPPDTGARMLLGGGHTRPDEAGRGRPGVGRPSSGRAVLPCPVAIEAPAGNAVTVDQRHRNRVLLRPTPASVVLSPALAWRPSDRVRDRAGRSPRSPSAHPASGESL